MIVYQEILARLAENGYTAYKLQKENLIAGSCLDRIRNGRPITTSTLDVICRLCSCQPGDLLTWQPDEKPGK